MNETERKTNDPITHETGEDPGSEFLKRIVIKVRKDKTIFIKFDTSNGGDQINPVEYNRFKREMDIAFRSYLGKASRFNAQKQREETLRRMEEEEKALQSQKLKEAKKDLVDAEKKVQSLTGDLQKV